MCSEVYFVNESDDVCFPEEKEEKDYWEYILLLLL